MSMKAKSSTIVFVTQRIKDIRRPRGRYLPIKLFSVENLDNHRVLHPVESESSGLVGICVVYFIRFMNGTDVRSTFRISTQYRI